MLKNNFFIKKFYEKCGLETSCRPFLIFKESSVEQILWRSACWFGQILIDCYYISNISSLLQKFHLPIKVMLHSLQTQKELELVFRPQFLYKFLMKFFILSYDINWQNFINRLYLLLKLFSEIYFLFYASAFDDVMKFENAEF